MTESGGDLTMRAVGMGATGRAAVALLATLAVAGCGLSDGHRNCTLMGGVPGVPGVTVLYEPGDGATTGPAGPAVFRLCVDGECDERTEASADADTRMYVHTPDDVRDKELDLRVSVTSVEGGRVIMEDSAKVRLTEYWPNGKGCGPDGVWAATLTATPGKGLVDR